MRSSLLVSSAILAVVTLGVTTAVTYKAFAQATPGTVIFDNAQQAQNQNSQPQSGGADPQGRVGRISLIDGTVSSHTPDQDAWSYASLNYPVVSGNSFWTEPNAKAEIQVGSDAIRLDGGTEIDVNQLDDHGTRIEISQGAVNLHVGNVEQGEVYQIITPHETINLLEPGTYRVKTGGPNSNEADEVAVLRGRTQVGDPQTSLTVNAGETAFIQAGNPPQINVQETAATQFDNWSLQRDNFEEPRQSTHYVSQEMTGYEDLDRYGNWQSDPAYGNVWIPTEVPTGWQPYHNGHWVFVSPWGWTWVDEAPWGFAPFHYGRWAYVHNRWGWIPGQPARHPVYAPALVAFIGGSGWSVSVGLGDRPVGWFPLGPNEVYRPGYHVSRDYVRNVNVTNVKNINVVNNYYSGQHGDGHGSNHDHFANQRYATVVPAKDFAASHPVDKVAIHVPENKLTAAPVNTTAAPPVAVERHAHNQNAPHGNYVPDNHGGPDHRTDEQNRPQTVQQPTAPNSPSQPVQPHVNTVQNPQTQAHEQNASRPEANPQQHHEQQAPAVAAAPGPPIEHRNRPADYQPSMHVNPAAPAPAIEAAHAQQHLNATVTQTTVQPTPRAEQPTPRAEQPMPRAETSQPALQAAQEQARERAATQPVVRPNIQPTPRPMPQQMEVQRPQQSAPLVPSHEGWVRKAPEPAAAPHVEAPHQTPQQPHAEQPHPAAEAPHAEHGHDDHGAQPPTAPNKP
jgi:hypothetical protein